MALELKTMKHWTWLLILALPLSIYGALFWGSYPLSASAVHQALWAMVTHGPESQAVIIIRDLRLARIGLALATGMALAVSGAVFQGLLRNPLADPFTLGVSSGAACAVALVLGLGLAWSLPLVALGGALGAMALVLVLSHLAGGFSRTSLVLGGIVVSTFLGAIIALIKALNEESVTSIVFWIMGSFQGRGLEHLWLMLPYLILGLVIIMAFSRELDLLAVDADQAALVGVHVGRSRVALLLGAGLLTAAAVSVSGIIGFVGLVVPHLIRLIMGPSTRPLIFYSALVGGVLLLWSDVLARIILPQGAELPVGVVTALFGGPVFCLILAKKEYK